MPVPVSDLQSAAPSAIIELFEIQLVQALHGDGSTYRFHDGTGGENNIIWAGNSYQRIPVQAEGFEYSGNGELPQPKLRVSNIASTITAVLAFVNATTPGNDLIGAKVTRIRTLAKYLDAVNFAAGNPTASPTTEFPREVYYISQKTAENRDVVEFALSSPFDLQGVKAPKRQCISNICQWVYRSSECGYTGTNYYDANDNPVGSLALDVCGKRVTSCAIRFARTSNLSTAGTTDRLLSNQVLLSANDAQIVAPNGWYRLNMQRDGNLVLYDKAGTPLWSSGTVLPVLNDAEVRLQFDGNLVITRLSNNQVLWATNTNGSGATRLEMQSDGNLVLYTNSNVAVWDTDTNSRNEPARRDIGLPYGSFPGVGTITS